MKIEKLSDNKIKITLDVNDLKTRNIDAKSFIYNSPESQDLFWDVMQEAETRYGFSVEESMVYVEAHVNNNGLFTLIVTKTAPSQSAPVAKQKKSNINFKLRRKETNPSLNNSIFKFNNLESLIDYAKIAKDYELGGNALYSYNNSYYLYAEAMPNNSILEYANKENNFNLIKSKINEYGKILYSVDALQEVNKLTHI